MNFLFPLLVGAPLLPLGLTVYNLLTWRRGTTDVDARVALSVLVPARNEQANIRGAVESALLASTDEVYVAEVVVYDDQSTDATADILRELSEREPRVRLVEGVPLPSGWVGKAHGCHRLLQAAQKECVLFMDADVRLEKQGLLRLLSLMNDDIAADLVTAVPAQVTGSFFERLILPLLTLTYTSWLPLRLSEDSSDPRFTAANGQLLLSRRTTLEKLGGFEAIRGEVVDDVALCRRAKACGLRVIFADGSAMARCRMYDSARGVWEGFSKNLYAGLGSPFALLLAMSLYFASFVLPYLALGAALLVPQASGLLVPAAVGVFLNVILRLLLLERFRHPKAGLILHPLGVVCLLALALNSFWWSVSGQLRWSGRIYPSRGES